SKAEPAMPGVGIDVDDQHEDVIQPAGAIRGVGRGDRPGQRETEEVGFKLGDSHTPSITRSRYSKNSFDSFDAGKGRMKNRMKVSSLWPGRLYFIRCFAASSFLSNESNEFDMRPSHDRLLFQ